MVLQEVLINTAKKFPNKIAFNDRFLDRRITYNKALIASIIFANRLKNLPDSFVGIMIPTSPGCAFAFIGALMAGKIPVMINYSTDAYYNVTYAQKKCDFSPVITSKALLEKINCPYIDGMVFIEDIIESISIKDKLIAVIFEKMPLLILRKFFHFGSADDTAVILFTSGSEKEPKAVELTHKNIISNIKSFSPVFELNSEDILLANLPYFHVFGLTVNLWTPIYHGMTMISYPNPLDFQKICQIIREEKPTVMAATPSFWWGYLKRSEEGDFESLRILMSGADKCPQTLRDNMWQKHKKNLLEGYGTTETSPVISANSLKENKPGSIGKPIPGVQVMIENYETGEPCKAGEVGRIMVKGDNVMKGYFDDIEETAMRIRHGWYDTGDMGYIDEDGFLWHVGRLKRFVKIGGEMVSLVKIEDVLEKILPNGVECCAVEIPDETKGAKIVVAVTEKIDEKKIITELSSHLPNIAIPKQFIVLEELPKMGSGKVHFRKVTEMVKEILRKK